MEERRGVYRVLLGKPEGKRPLGKPRHTWEDNMKVDLQEMGWEVGGFTDICVKSYVANFQENPPLNSKTDNNIWHCTWGPKYVHVVYNSKKCFAVRKQCKRNQIFRFHGKNQ